MHIYGNGNPFQCLLNVCRFNCPSFSFHFNDIPALLPFCKQSSVHQAETTLPEVNLVVIRQTTNQRNVCRQEELYNSPDLDFRSYVIFWTSQQNQIIHCKTPVITYDNMNMWR